MSPVSLDALFAQAAETGAFDLHLVPGQPPVFRVNGSLQKNDGPPLTSADISDMVLPYLPEPARTKFATGQIMWAETLVSLPDAPLDFDLRVFRAQNEVSASVRVVLPHVPTLEQIGLLTTPLLQKAAEQKSGMILFTGPHQSGKTTPACAVIEAINASRSERIFFVEESPSYRLVDKNSIITRWQVGPDVDSYEAASRLLRKCDADIVFFSDLPTPEAVQSAVNLASRGHLVIAVLTANSVSEAISAILASFGAMRPIGEQQIARSLVAVFNQRLLPRIDKSGRAALYEVLWASKDARAALRAGGHIDWEALMESDENSQTRAQALAALQVKGIVADAPPAPQ